MILNFTVDNNTVQPVYKQVAQYLKECILSGAWEDGMRLPPEKELAAQLAINRMTLRKSLHLLSMEGLLSRAPSRGTFVSRKAERRIRIGIVVNSDREQPDLYLSRVLLETTFCISRYPNVEQVFVNEVDGADKIAAGGCDALLIALRSNKLYEKLKDPALDHLPMVFFNLYEKPLTGHRFSVSLDLSAVRSGVEYLQSAGHKKIAYISTEKVQIRNREFLNCAPPEAETHIAGEGKGYFQTGFDAASEICRRKERPSAIFVPGIGFAAGVWHGVTRCGLRIPEDISLLSFDSVSATFPALSTIDQPMRAMAEQAVELLISSCNGTKYRKHQFFFAPIMNDRGSVKKVNS